MRIHKTPTFAACLEESGVACVYVVPTKTLKLPPGLLYPVMLEYGFAMPNPIRDLRWTEEGIYATLSFDRTPFETFVPWSSVISIGPKGADFIVSWHTAWVADPGNEDATRNPPTPTPAKTTLRLVK